MPKDTPGSPAPDPMRDPLTVAQRTAARFLIDAANTLMTGWDSADSEQRHVLLRAVAETHDSLRTVFTADRAAGSPHG